MIRQCQCTYSGVSVVMDLEGGWVCQLSVDVIGAPVAVTVVLEYCLLGTTYRKRLQTSKRRRRGGEKSSTGCWRFSSDFGPRSDSCYSEIPESAVVRRRRHDHMCKKLNVSLSAL